MEGSELLETAKNFLRREPHIDASVQALWYTDTTDALTGNAKTGATALHLAAYFGLERLVADSLKSSPDINAQDSLGYTAMIYAALEGYHVIVAQMLECGASVNAICHSGSKMLHMAVSEGHVDVVKVLLRYADLDVNVSDPSQRSRNALMLAAMYGNEEVVQHLLGRDDLCLDLRERAGKTALMVAAINELPGIVTLLLRDPRVSINDQGELGRTALMLAAYSGCTSTVGALLDAGADSEITDGTEEGGGTPLLRAIDCDHLPIVRHFLQRNINGTAKDKYGRTLLHGAAINGRDTILQLLLEQTHDLDVNARDDNGRVALHDRSVPPLSQT